MRVRIDDLNDDGRGRGRLGRRVALLSQALPGEEVTLRLDRSTRGTLQGRVGRLIEARPDRQAHSCPHEFACTGCPLLAAPPDLETEFKTERVRRALESAGATAESLAPLVRPTDLFAYRHYAKQVVERRGRRIVLGSYVAGSHELADNRACPILAPELAALLDRVAELLEWVDAPVAGEGGDGVRYVLARRSRAQGTLLLGLVTSSDEPEVERKLCASLVEEVPELVGAHVLVNRQGGNAIAAGRWEVGAGEREIVEELGGVGHRVGLASFFQINPAAAEVLLEEVLRGAGTGELCLEGFSGVGAFTLPLSRRFARVQAVESVAEAAEALRREASRLEGDVEVAVADAGTWIPDWLQDHAPDAVVLDPPRKGLGPAIVEALARSRARRLVLVACEPASLARDLPGLLEAGYRLERVLPVDQFPRTAHVEVVATLARS